MIQRSVTRRRIMLPAIASALLITGCDDAPPEETPAEEATEVPEELSGADTPVAPADADPDGEALGTPRGDRVATLGLLNKRNNVSRDIEMKPGEARRVGNVVLRLSTCEHTPPWEMPTQTGAFVQVTVQQRANAGEDLSWQRVFSGWLFKESPGVNVVEHPVYDVWLKDCAMSFPGEEDDAEASDSSEA